MGELIFCIPTVTEFSLCAELPFYCYAVNYV